MYILKRTPLHNVDLSDLQYSIYPLLLQQYSKNSLYSNKLDKMITESDFILLMNFSDINFNLLRRPFMHLFIGIQPIAKSNLLA